MSSPGATLPPFHTVFTELGDSSDLEDFVSPIGTVAHVTFTELGDSSDLEDFVPSGFGVVTDAGGIFTISEGQYSGDAWIQTYQQCEEGQYSGDGFGGEIFTCEEGAYSGDEYEGSSDLFTIEEGAYSGDFEFVNVFECEEGQYFGDSYSLTIHNALKRSFVTQIRAHKEIQRSFITSILGKTTIPTQDISNPANTFAPLVYKQGVKLGGVGSRSGAFNLIRVNWAGIFPAAACEDIISWNIQYGWTGGTWDIKLKGFYFFPPHAVLDVCGFQGIVTYCGPESNDQLEGTIVSGIFGSEKMNQDILLVAKRIPGINTADQYLRTPASSDWSSCKAAATAIADFAGVSLEWYAPDMTLTDVFAESGMKVQEVLDSLAKRVGADLVWRGNDQYVVVTPDISLGGFAIPDCTCYKPEGARYGFNADMQGSVLLLPVSSGLNSSVQKIPKPLVTPFESPVEPLETYRSKLNAGDAPYLIEKPQDFDSLKIRVLATDGAAGPYFTSNGTDWFGASLPQIYDADRRQTYFVLDHTQFSDSFRNNVHVMSVGYNRKKEGLENAYTKMAEEALQQQRLATQSQQERLHYFEESSGFASVNFFGVMPTTHGLVGISKGNVTYQALLKSVSFTSPNNISFQLGNWVQVAMDTARSKLNWYLATGNL